VATVSITIPAGQVQRVQEAFQSETGLTPREAILKYIRETVKVHELKTAIDAARSASIAAPDVDVE
jgi:hypothetical protein